LEQENLIQKDSFIDYLKETPNFLSVFIFSVFFIPTSAFADMLIGSHGSDWQSWDSSYLNNNGNPYWDRSSWDGSNKNIGHCLTSNTCGSYSTPPGAIPYWGMDDGAADPSFYFKNPALYSTASFKLEIAGNAAFNSFGYYNKSDPGTLHTIFAGVDTPGVPDVNFSPTGDYGFYIKVNGEFFTTEDGGAPGFQHFAVFSEGSSYWIGMEDFHGGSDFDYNDIVVKITPVPEPATMLLLGSGLIGLAGYARKRFKK